MSLDGFSFVFGSPVRPQHRTQTGILRGETRWREVAKKIGYFALTTLVFVGAIACLTFIPGAPLYAAGTLIFLGLTGSLTGAAAVGAAVGLTVGTFIAWNAAFATGAILGEKRRHEEEQQQRFTHSPLLPGESSPPKNTTHKETIELIEEASKGVYQPFSTSAAAPQVMASPQKFDNNDKEPYFSSFDFPLIES
jgi:hypothetical protein